MANKYHRLSPDKYKSPPNLAPKDKATQTLYYEIYNQYAFYHMTEKQIAEQRGYSPAHISRIIKWAVNQISEPDADIELRVLIDKSKQRQQEIEMEIQKVKSEKVKLGYYSELRQLDMFIARLQGLLSTALIDNSDNRKTVNVITNPELVRGARERMGEEVIDIDASSE